MLEVSSDLLKPPSLKPPFAALQNALQDRRNIPFVSQSYILVRILSSKKKLYELKSILETYFLLCNGLHDWITSLGNLVGKRFGGDGM